MATSPSIDPEIPVPRAVLFDMDDTIFDHSLTCRDALERIRAEHRVFEQRPLDELWREYSRLLEAIHPEVIAGRWAPEVARRRRFQQLAAFAGGTLSANDAEAVSREYRRHYQSLRRAVPGAANLLEHVHGRTSVAVVTNNEVAEQQEKLSFLGLAHLVDQLVVSEETGVAKPDPRIFEIALARMGATAAESVMVGDSWPNDVLGARNAGVGAVWFNRFGSPPLDPAEVPELRSLEPTAAAAEVVFRAAGKTRTATP